MYICFALKHHNEYMKVKAEVVKKLTRLKQGHGLRVN